MPDWNRFKTYWVQVRKGVGLDWERVVSRLREDGN